MIYDISHRTTYRYGAPVAQSNHVLHLAPREWPGQTIRRHSLMLEPAPTSRVDLTDYFGNAVSIFTIEVDHRESVMHARSTIEVRPPSPVDLAASAPWETVRDLAANPGAAGADVPLDVAEFACRSRHTLPSDAIRDYALPSFAPGRPSLQAVWDLIARINTEFTFDATATDISTPLARVLEQRRGVCQDFAHLALACLRVMGLPGRYVSGYLLTKPPPGMPKLQGADASHAWIAAWAPETGWIEFDPTNKVIPAGEHIAIAWGRDFEDVSPISGVLLGGGDHTVKVAVDVTPVGS